MPMYEYRCREGHVTELLRPRTVEVVACACGAPAGRAQVYPFAVSGFTPIPRDEKNYRQDFREFTEARAEAGDYYGRLRANGDPVNEPDYATIARAQAPVRAAAKAEGSA